MIPIIAWTHSSSTSGWQMSLIELAKMICGAFTLSGSSSFLGTNFTSPDQLPAG
jgi:hypothetical protein